MKYIRFVIFLFFITHLFSQELFKEPVAEPAPFELLRNLDLSKVIQPLAKSATVGDTTFYIRENLRDDNVKLESVEFYKLFESETIVIYAECSEFDSGRVTQQTIDNISKAMLEETPAGSVDPSKGMLENLQNIYGEFPDVDNNEKLFVLLIDARDEYDPETSESYVAGYFDPIDQRKSKGNYSDIIYIDTNPARATDPHTLGVVAHELQHLIHWNYDSDESTWLNEGFSELAPQLLGYESHSFARFLSGTNKKLTDFDGSLLDYSKVSLWSFYIYKRFGLDAIHAVLRNPTNSSISYETSLQSLGYNITFRELLTDWFLANLLNDPTIESGIFSYYGESIPDIETEFSHSNFTEGEIIFGNVLPQAAQYIQFNGGRNIYFSLDMEVHSLSEVRLIKHKTPTEIDVIDISSGSFDFEDLLFGENYDKLSLVLSWTASVSPSQSLDFSYSAVGVGGFEEIEYKNDNDTLDYYISINSNYHAAERFYSDQASEITAIKFNCGTSNPVDIKLYADLSRSPFQTFYNVESNGQSWTTYTLENPIPISEAADYYIAITSANTKEISVGYSDDDSGKDWAFLDAGGGYRDLDNFTIDDGLVLSGNWMIRTLNRREIFKEPELVIDPDTLIFLDDDSTAHILTLKNLGTEVLKWSVESHPPNLSLSDSAGMISSGKKEITITPDYSNLISGLYESGIYFKSDLIKDSVHTIMVKKNPTQSQTAFLLPTDTFEENLIRMKVFNIGTGTGRYSIKEYPSYLAVNPKSQLVYPADTVIVDLMIDTTLVSSERFGFVFDNGINDSYRNLKYKRTISNKVSESLKIYSAMPNPFNPFTRKYTNFMMHLKNNKAATLSIYNVKGELIYTIKIESPQKGQHMIDWNGLTNQGNYAPSGVYFVEIKQGNERDISKMAVIK